MTDMALLVADQVVALSDRVQARHQDQQPVEPRQNRPIGMKVHLTLLPDRNVLKQEERYQWNIDLPPLPPCPMLELNLLASRIWFHRLHLRLLSLTVLVPVPLPHIQHMLPMVLP